MSTFPPLTPSGTRTFTPGERPHTPQRSMGGGASLVLHSDGIVGQRLRLSFLRLTEAEMRQIRAHYISRRGRFYGFDLPAEVWSASTSTQTPSGYQWHYAGTPQVSDVFCGLYDVELDLEMLPVEVPAVSIPAAVISIAGVAPVIVADLSLQPIPAVVTVAGIPPRVSTT